MTRSFSTFWRFLGAGVLAAGVGAASPAALSAQAIAAGQPIDGIPCQTMEGAVFHIHPHLTLLDHGKPVEVPANIGIPGRCLYWLHTHTNDGIIHVESPQFGDFTLGEFFDIWGQPLSATAAGPAHVPKGQLKMYVNGTPYRGNPRKIVFAQHTDIVLEAGPPYSKPVPFTEWNGN